MAVSESALLHAVSLVCTVGAWSLPIEDSPPKSDLCESNLPATNHLGICTCTCIPKPYMRVTVYLSITNPANIV
jgi:hypothetical protein